MISRRIGLVLGLAATAVLLGISGTVRSAPSAHAPESVAVSSADIIRRMSALLYGVPLPQARVAELARAIDEGRTSEGTVIDQLVADPKVAGRLGPALILGTYNHMPAHGQNPDYELRPQRDSAQPKSEPVWSLDEEPCPRARATQVHPWWNLSSTILVCNESYRPKARTAADGKPCSRSRFTPTRATGCGCGPNLVLCTTGDAQTEDIMNGYVEESRLTIARVVANDLPLSTAFTSNATVRPPLAEFDFEREQLLAGRRKQLDDWRAWPMGGRLAPRPEVTPGQHAGILTDRHLLNTSESLRLRQVGYAEILWCIETRAVTTPVEAIIALGHGNFRDGEDWDKLAAKPFCTNCHARMDYGNRFFEGWPRAIDAFYYQPALAHTSVGPLYLTDIHDPRGSAPLTAQGFAQLAVAQPEFRRCMAQRIGDHVFGPGYDADASDAMLTAYQDHGGAFRPMLRAALLEYARRLRHAEMKYPATGGLDDPPSLARARSGASLEEKLVSTPALSTQIESRCATCHDKPPLDLSSGTLTRADAVRMMSQVASSTMLKGNKTAMPPAERRVLIERLIDVAWHRDADRAEARRVFIDEVLSGRAARTDDILTGMARKLGVPTKGLWPLVQLDVRRNEQFYSPAVMVFQSLEALRACRAAGKTGAALDDCVGEGIRIDDTTIDPSTRP